MTLKSLQALPPLKSELGHPTWCLALKALLLHPAVAAHHTAVAVHHPAVVEVLGALVTKNG